MDKKKPKILIANDEQLFVQLMEATLQDEYDLFFAFNSDEAFEIANREAPDLVLLDVVMAPKSGFDICHLLKSERRTRDIPILFVTSSTTAEDEVKGLEMGAVDYITKPVSPPIVKARVRNHMELKQYKDKLERIAAEDVLTGLATRRRFEDVFQSEWRRCRRHESPLSIAMLDIDYFKPFNDNYGHGAGDECLRKVGRALGGEVKRAADLVARYGGEEFVCLMPDTDLEGASAFGHVMRKAVSDLQVRHEYSNVNHHVTMSIGIATCTPDENIEPYDLVRRADRKLYEAKKGGRNRVESANYEKKLEVHR
ncbi:MAG: diguanylate cyclase [Rhodospirillaceae bacterium]|nr:diguanylate cyclase [Rhodospirillaceae bacterium]